MSDVWRQHIWLRPLVVLIVLASVGWGMQATVEAMLKANMQSVLEATQREERTASQNWSRMHCAQAKSAAATAEAMINSRPLGPLVPMSDAVIDELCQAFFGTSSAKDSAK